MRIFKTNKTIRTYPRHGDVSYKKSDLHLRNSILWGRRMQEAWWKKWNFHEIKMPKFRMHLLLPTIRIYSEKKEVFLMFMILYSEHLPIPFPRQRLSSDPEVPPTRKLTSRIRRGVGPEEPELGATASGAVIAGPTGCTSIFGNSLSVMKHIYIQYLFLILPMCTHMG